MKFCALTASGLRFDVFDEFRNVERVRAGLQIKRDEADERDERADAQIQRDLERRVVLLFAAAPDADHDERRHQREFVQEIKEEQIQRRKRAEDAAGHHEQQDVKFLFARLDFPRAERGGERDNRAHQNQADVQAVHADVIADAERFDPRNLLHKLIAVRVHRRAGELAEHFHRQHRRDERGQHRDGADDDAVIARHKDQHQRRQQRPTCDVSQNGHFIFPKRNTAPAPRRARTGRRRSGDCRFARGAARVRSNPCRRAIAPMQSAFHNPAVNPVANRRDEIMRADERGFVKFVEVKFVLHRRRQAAEFGGQRIAGGIFVKREGQENSGQRRRRCRSASESALCSGSSNCCTTESVS